MNLLPKTHQEFSSTEYWDQFFKKRGAKAFEWYGEYPDLCGVLHKYIKPQDKILHIGCGNSQLGADLYDVGCKNIINIDISETAVKQMKEKNAEQRPGLEFRVMDMMQMEFPDNEFNVILDKGTLDAIMTDSSPEVQKKVDTMFSEICRVLKPCGRYICVSLAQEHILKKVLDYFPEQGWPVRIHPIEVAPKTDDGPRDFQMPVFAFTFTKFKKMPNSKQILEVLLTESKVDRLDDVNQMISTVKEMQQYAMVRQQVNKKSYEDELLSLDLYSAGSSNPRFTLYIVDSATRGQKNKFAIFIVPQGRETEWIFSTKEGRKDLAKSANFQRLIVVTLHRDHTYDSMDSIKAELSAKVLELKPIDLKNEQQVPFLSVGEDIGSRTVLHRGSSDTTGEYVVEDIESDNKEKFRQLIFLNNKHVVQSQARLIPEPTRKKSGKKRGQGQPKLVIDAAYLACQHHTYMVAGLAFVQGLRQYKESSLGVCLVGLGGGALPLFMHKYLNMVSLDVVEIDPNIVSIATDWFGFQESERMKIHVQDGLEYINNLAEKGVKKHVIMFDCDSKDSSIGMTCPPKPFIETEFLKKVDKILHPEGVFVLNFVCREKTLKATVLENLKSVFKTLYCKNIPDEVNDIIYAFPSSRSHDTETQTDSLPPEVSKQFQEIQDIVQSQKVTKDCDVLKLVKQMKDLSVV